MKYVVWGGWKGQDEGDHFADFETLEQAQEYKRRFEAEDQEVILHISARDEPMKTPALSRSLD